LKAPAISGRVIKVKQLLEKILKRYHIIEICRIGFI